MPHCALAKCHNTEVQQHSQPRKARADLPSAALLVCAIATKECRGYGKQALRARAAAGVSEKAIRRKESEVRELISVRVLSAVGSPAKVIGAFSPLLAKLPHLMKLYQTTSWAISWDGAKSGWTAVGIAPFDSAMTHLSPAHWFLLATYHGKDNQTGVENYFRQSLLNEQLSHFQTSGHRFVVLADWEGLRATTHVYKANTRTTDCSKEMCHFCGITKSEMTTHSRHTAVHTTKSLLPTIPMLDHIPCLMHGRVRVWIWVLTIARPAFARGSKGKVDKYLKALSADGQSPCSFSGSVSLSNLSPFLDAIPDLTQNQVAWIQELFTHLVSLTRISLQGEVSNSESQVFKATCKSVLVICEQQQLRLWPWVHFWLEHCPDLLIRHKTLRVLSLCGFEHNHKRVARYVNHTFKLGTQLHNGPGCMEAMHKDNRAVWLLQHGQKRPPVC